MDDHGNVILAKAGIQEAKLQAGAEFAWMPACAGMTEIDLHHINWLRIRSTFLILTPDPCLLSSIQHLLFFQFGNNVIAIAEHTAHDFIRMLAEQRGSGPHSVW